MPVNYPWLLAVIALVALFVVKGREGSGESGEALFVGPPSDPVIGENFLLGASVGGTEIGTAFVVLLDKNTDPVVLTALHRFGPAGGLAQTAGTGSSAKAAESLRLRGAGGELDGVSLVPLEIGAAGPLGTSAAAGDIAGFAASGGEFSPVGVETSLPEAGSNVWLIVWGEGGGVQPLRSTVFATDPQSGLIYYRLPNESLTLAEANAVTGAPIVNLGGQVLGMHVGAASDEGGSAPYGMAQGAAKFLPHLLQAVADLSEPAAMASAGVAEPK